ncbi:MAG: hypothetical protein AAB019_00240 [Planctomycetota bacterium]
MFKKNSCLTTISLLVFLFMTVATLFSTEKEDEAAQEVLKQMSTEARKIDYTTIKEIKNKEEIIVLPGQYDKVEKVLDAFKIPYQKVANPVKFTKETKLDNTCAVIINCIDGAVFPQAFIDKIKLFVENGGYLFTSDWALPVITRAFPGYISQSTKTTGRNEQVVITPHPDNAQHPFLKDIFGPGRTDLKWALEIQSFCVRIDKPDEVKILIESQEMQAKYNSAPIAITFDITNNANLTPTATARLKPVESDNPVRIEPKSQPDGTVLHIVSHLYQQGLENTDKKNVSSMYQLIVNFLVEAKKSAKEREADKKSNKKKKK